MKTFYHTQTQVFYKLVFTISTLLATSSIPLTAIANSMILAELEPFTYSFAQVTYSPKPTKQEQILKEQEVEELSNTDDEDDCDTDD